MNIPFDYIPIVSKFNQTSAFNKGKSKKRPDMIRSF